MKFSVITINLNNREGLERTIKSITTQSATDFELIVVDGGSTDGSLKVAESYSSSIHFFVSEPDRGVYDAQNKGILNSNGDYVIFMNSGDEFASDNSLSLMERSLGDEDFAFGDVMIRKDKAVTQLKKYTPTLTPHFLLNDTICHQTMIFKRSVFEKWGLYDLSYSIAADYEFLLRMILSHSARYKYINETIAIVDAGGISDQRESGLSVWYERRKAQKKYFPGDLLYENTRGESDFRNLLKGIMYHLYRIKLTKGFVRFVLRGFWRWSA